MNSRHILIAMVAAVIFLLFFVYKAKEEEKISNPPEKIIRSSSEIKSSPKKINSFEKIIGENTSPLFRIKAVKGLGTPQHAWGRDIFAFHIGKGYFLSVCHNLIEGKKGDEQLINLYKRNISKPYLLIHQKKDALFGNPHLNSYFADDHKMYEGGFERFLFLVDVELVEIITDHDIAIYKIADNFKDLIPHIPSIKIDTKIYDIGNDNYYGLQSAPYNEIGHMIHKVSIEGYVDHFSEYWNVDAIRDGFRYLTKGYLKFGSSGSPYLYYDKDKDEFRANAIQSELFGIQMRIGDSRDNTQYVNAIATPLFNIKEKLQELGF